MCVLQQGKSIAYASRIMRKVELTYEQIQNEILSIVYAVRKIHQYIYGKDHTVIENDHKPFETIVKNRAWDGME